MGWVAKAVPAAAAATAAVVAIRDLRQRNHALLRNFPLLGHARYALESIGPELRQYLVAGNNEERPFTRDQRRWVYASASAPTTTSSTPLGTRLSLTAPLAAQS